MIWKHRILMDLAFDCTPPEGSEDEAIDIAKGAFVKIGSFLEGEEGEPPIGKATKRLNSFTDILSMTVKIPHPDYEQEGPDLATVGSLYTKLKNSLGQFPPEVANNLPVFKFLAAAEPDPPEEEEEEE